ncbi:MAG: hypothetical protein ITG02_01385 [Patulibacter sp.]|nr:hypothetical protein [Patulibacter sp.]
MALTGAHRILLAAVAVVVAAGIAVVIDDGGGERAAPRSPIVARAGAPRTSGVDLAASLAGTTAIRTTPATHDEATLLRVADQQEVDTERAWPLEIPGDRRTAWLFAGPARVALVVPRTVVDPQRGPQPDTSSIFGARIADLVDQPLIASQAGGGQAPRVLVLVPAGVSPPRIVAHDGTQTIREMSRRGRLYAGQLRTGEELVVGRRRIGPTTP